MIPWAVFDPAWYLASYPDVTDDDPLSVLDHYLRHGQSRGDSPNRLFDEQWHRLRYPRIAEKIADGLYASAFDAYCRRGALDRSGHWLFDELAYRDRYPDLTNHVLAATQICNGYDHYLRHGSEEHRIGHKLFDPAFYLSHFDAADVPAIRAGGVFQHYLVRIESGQPELSTSIYFDPAWYLRRYPEVALGIVAKRWKCALQHYLCNDRPTEFDPLASFSEAWYLQRDPRLREAIASGNFSNGYMHFLRFGSNELRPPSATIDLAWYASQPTVLADLASGHAPDAFAHWLTLGAPTGLRSAEPEAEKITEAQARSLSHLAAAAALPIAGRFGYRFDRGNEASVSVVVVVSDGFAMTMSTIASLRASTALPLELIIVDCGSKDETRSIGQYVPGARILRFEQVIPWSRAADAGRQLATAPAVLFLSSATLIAYGSVDRAAARLTADASVGAVGGMILQPHRVIAIAGGILWNDGGIHGYERGASALAPEANFVRDVDFCTSAFLLVRTALLSQLDGFDHDCTAGYEAVDLCLRTAQAGLRVVYDPSVRLVLSEPTQLGDDGCGEYFRHKHADHLVTQNAPGGSVEIFARHAGIIPHRVLFIEDTVPLRRSGSGFVRANDLIKVMVSLGCSVTVFPVNGCHDNLAHVFSDMPDTVEVMHTLALHRLAGFLEARAEYYDTVWVARAHNLASVRPFLARLTGRIVLDTEAMTPNREAMQAALAGTTYDLEAAMQAMLANADICHRTIAVTPAETETLRRHGFPAPAMVGHMIEPRPTERPFAERSGILFVGAIHTQDSPNLDSLTWFVDSILPLIEVELKWETRLTIAGYVAPGVDLSRFENHPRITLRGSVGDLSELYNAHRVFIAPTRYAAGAPYKVLEAASQGLPVIASDLLRVELGWLAGEEMLTAEAHNPVAFAAAVLTLYRDEVLWQVIRAGALGRVVQDYGSKHYADAVAAVLAPGPGTETTRPNPGVGEDLAADFPTREQL